MLGCLYHYRLSVKGLYSSLGNKGGAMHVRWNLRMSVHMGLGHYGGGGEKGDWAQSVFGMSTPF